MNIKFAQWFNRTPSSDDEIQIPVKPKQEKVPNPYLNARRVWNTEAMALMSSQRAWMVVGIVSMIIAAIAVMGALHVGAQSKFVPYVVQVDNLGQMLYSGTVKQAAAADRRIIRAMLHDFITHSRIVTKDERLQTQAVHKTYAYLLSNFPSTQKMNEYMNSAPESTPFARAKKLTVETDIDTILQRTPDTWQVDWIETVRYASHMTPDERYRMRAVITTAFLPPDSKTPEEQIMRNPIGMYIKDFSWTKQQVEEK